MACQESSNKVGDVINKELLEILNCQLNRLQLVESNKIGATRLVPKVEEVPRPGCTSSGPSPCSAWTTKS